MATTVVTKSSINVSAAAGAFSLTTNTYTVPANSYLIISYTACISYASGSGTITVNNGNNVLLATFSSVSTQNYPGGIFIGPGGTVAINGGGAANTGWGGVLFVNT